MFVLMEDVVLTKLRSMVGWLSGDGIFCPGGSISNIFGMNVARYHAFPEVKRQGLWALPRLAVFTSQDVRTKVQLQRTWAQTVGNCILQLKSIRISI